jgi:hypothetical protein
MDEMEYRAFLTIPGLDFDKEKRWEPFIERLERTHGDLGPVIGFVEGGAEVVLAMDSDGEAAVATRAVEIVAECLQAVGLAGLYPRVVEVEPVPDDELATA